jgi:hypothetical protein
MRELRDGDRLLERLHELNRAVEALNALQTQAPFETIVRVTAEFGMLLEAALTPRAADKLRAGLPLLDYDSAGKAVRRIALFDGRFTLEWPFRKHTLDKHGGG